MSFKLAFKNIKKSIKDYSIYFFTLVVAVSIFYIFNSLDTQESMLVLSESKHNLIQSLIYILNYVSIFISFVLGFLIIYSNNFLVKRRKKEFGLYLTLGMSKWKVSLILVLETIIVGFLSLIVGLLVGVFLSQFLSIITAKLFEVDASSYTFVFSKNALIKTLLYFGIMFVFVMIFNVIAVSKNKLIDLLNASKKNEKVKFRNKYVTIISFILSITLIGYAYYLLFHGALISMDTNFAIMIITGALGTLLLFFSLSGFLLKICEKIKIIYYKGLNLFILKQVNNKINSSVFSTTIICLMLLLTIGILSGSLSLISVYNTDFNNTNTTDFTILEYESNCVFNENRECVFVKADPLLKNIISKDYFNKYVKEYAYYEVYIDDNVTIGSLIDDKTKKELLSAYGNSIEFGGNLDIISESAYNEILKVHGRSNEIVDIDTNHYLLTSGISKVTEMYDSFYKNNGTINIYGSKLLPETKEIVSINFQNFSSDSNFGTVVVDDELINGLELNNATIIGNYVNTSDIEKTEKEFFENVKAESGAISYTTKLDMRESTLSVKIIVIFVCIYLGITFAISSATILAIGQLSESNNNKERYEILRKIGTENKMIKRALFTQISIAFILPFIVALIHAYFGLRQVNRIIEIVGDLNLSSNILLTALFITIIYGGYFIATYLCSKNIIREK